MAQGVQRFTDLRAWQACVTYKRAIYQLCEKEPLVNDWKRRGQLEESLLESQNHLIDLVDRGYISDDQRTALNGLPKMHCGR